MIKFFPDSKTFLSIGIDIRWYAVLILIGVLFTYLVSKRDFKKAKYDDRDFFDSLIVYSLWVGIIGARLWFCMFYNFSYYTSNPSAIIRIWDGGLAIQGGIVAGFIYVYFYTKKHKIDFHINQIISAFFRKFLLYRLYPSWPLSQELCKAHHGRPRKRGQLR